MRKKNKFSSDFLRIDRLLEKIKWIFNKVIWEDKWWCSDWVDINDYVGMLLV